MKRDLETKFWVCFQGSSEVTELSLSQIGALGFDRYAIMLMSDLRTPGDWRKPSEFGVPHPSDVSCTMAGQLTTPTVVDPSSDIVPAEFKVLASDVQLDLPYEKLSLMQLASAIIELNQIVGQAVNSTRSEARRSVQEATKLGHALQAAKFQVPHGCWAQWLEEQVREVSHDQAIRYMKLAKHISHVRNLDEIGTLRQAYLATGVISSKRITGVRGSVSDEIAREEKSCAQMLKQFQAFRILLEEFAQAPTETKSAVLAKINKEIQKISDLFDNLKSRLINNHPSPSTKRSRGRTKAISK